MRPRRGRAIGWAAVLVLAWAATGCGHGRAPSGHGQVAGEAVGDERGWRWRPANEEAVTRASRWALRVLAGGDAVLFAVVADGAGGAVVAGHGSGIVSLGALTVRLSQRDAAFLARVDPDGKPLWLRELEGADWSRRHESGGGLARDAAGNLYYAGTRGRTDELLVIKLDADGRTLWERAAGGPPSPSPEVRNHVARVAVDAGGAITIAGSLHGTVAFDAMTLSARGASDAFVARLDAGGRFLWAALAGSESASWEGAQGLALDGAGGAILTGRFAGSALFGEHLLQSEVGAELFVARVDGAGRFLWATRAPASPILAGYQVRLDAAGGIYLCGALPLELSVAKKPGPTCPLGSCEPPKQQPWSEDLYRPGVEHATASAVVARLTAAGDFLWAEAVGEPPAKAGWANDLLVDAGRVLVAGAQASGGPTGLLLRELDAETGLTVELERLGGEGRSAAMALAPDGRGGLFVVGGVEGTATLDGTTISAPGWSGFLWRRP